MKEIKKQRRFINRYLVNVVLQIVRNNMKMSLHYSEISEGATIAFMILLLLMVTSCEQRDPQAEYELLCETVFSSPREGETKAKEYIDYFKGKKDAKLIEAAEIRDQYKKMNIFSTNSFSSYADFINKSHELNYELSYSNYDGVRKMWLSLYEKTKKRMLAPLMDSITMSDFEDFFRTQVRQLCDNRYRHWNVESIDQVSLTTPILIEGGMAKKSSGEYLVHLHGSIFHSSNTTSITIEGTIGPDEKGNVVLNRTHFSFFNEPFIK